MIEKQYDEDGLEHGIQKYINFLHPWYDHPFHFTNTYKHGKTHGLSQSWHDSMQKKLKYTKYWRDGKLFGTEIVYK